MGNSVKIESYTTHPQSQTVFVNLTVIILGVTLNIQNIPVQETTLNEMAKHDLRNTWDEHDLKVVVSSYFQLLSTMVTV